jgi:hypothetical protein
VCVCALKRDRIIEKSDYWRFHVCLSVRPSAWNNSALNWEISKKLGYINIFQKFLINNKFHYNLTRITGTIHEYLQYVHLSEYLAKLLLKWEFFRRYRKNQYTDYIFNNVFRKPCHL